ncbi:GNAT family N-acetyltransferase [Paenibacillus tundrae]|uniref:GNAT family N-acetyltransferase n=1 Tax=Paenibacillus tundrae TaxID=528187 RepID=UPI0030CBD9ED
MPEYTIRCIQITDVHDIYKLNQHFNSQFVNFGVEQVKQKIETILEHTRDVVWVYEQNNEVLGYIHGSPYQLLFSEPLVNVLGFVVKEGYRNQGIGGRLIQHLESWAQDQGYYGIKLLSHPSRKNAHAFYEKRGYQFTKDQKNFIKMLIE